MQSAPDFLQRSYFCRFLFVLFYGQYGQLSAVSVQTDIIFAQSLGCVIGISAVRISIRKLSRERKFIRTLSKCDNYYSHTFKSDRMILTNSQVFDNYTPPSV